MLIVSFNVNSLRTRLHQMEALIADKQPDIIGLQETKVQDSEFPVSAIESMGYHVAYHGQKTHYGVALMSKHPLLDVQKGYPSDSEDAQRRLISASVELKDGRQLRVINGYFPQGEARSHETKFPAKEKFYHDLNQLLSQRDPSELLCVIGDFNIAPLDCDIGIGPDNAKRWLRTGKTSFLPEEREWMNKLYHWGLTDTYRHLKPENQEKFSWFDYRSKGFDREPRRGLRIDHILATEPLLDKVVESDIDYDIRAMQRPSDHCPVWTRFEL